MQTLTGRKTKPTKNGNTKSRSNYDTENCRGLPVVKVFRANSDDVKRNRKRQKREQKSCHGEAVSDATTSGKPNIAVQMSSIFTSTSSDMQDQVERMQVQLFGEHMK